MSESTKDSKKELEHEEIRDEEGNVVKLRLNKEKLFRDRWDGVIEATFYCKKHVQRISLALQQSMGEQGKDWETYSFGFENAFGIIKNNLEAEHPDDIVRQKILVGYKDNGRNDPESLKKALGRLKLRFLGGN